LNFRVAIWQWRYLLVALAAGVAAMQVLQVVAPTPPPVVNAVFAARDLPVGTNLTAEDLLVTPVPAQFAQGLATQVDEIAGRVTTTGIGANSPVWLSGVSSSDLGSVAPPGTVVVPLKLDAVTTSILTPGDRVDLIAATAEGSVTVANSALVLPPRFETESGGSGLFSSPGTMPTPITLVAVTPTQAPNLAAHAHQNQVTAILIP
jgi:Flp pilus assembly protein CpaB